MANLTDRLDDVLHWIWHVEYADVVEANVIKSNNGDGYQLYIDHLRVKDASKVRTNRFKTELNDVDIPSVEDPNGGILAITLKYRREITCLCGLVFEDRPVLEKTTQYLDGRKDETREVLY